MKTETVLITGATGFLGRRLSKAFLTKGYKVIGTGHSESGIKEFERLFNNDIQIFQVDIGGDGDYTVITNILKKFPVDYIVHAAALKHVGICENNPSRAVDVNVVGSQKLIRAAINRDIKNMIAISTDKSVKPLCVYGMTKKLMEEMFLEHDFGVFQGVNFLFSTGSVLDIWDKLRLEEKPILVNTKAKRYFCLIDEVCDKIIGSIDLREIFSVNECYNISISDLQKAFSTYHDYWNVDEFTPLDVEKHEEDLLLENINILHPDTDTVTKLLCEHYRNHQV